MRGRVTKIKSKNKGPGLGNQLKGNPGSSAPLGAIGAAGALGGLGYLAHKALETGKEAIGESRVLVLDEATRIEIANEVRRNLK
jgi:hypothetical protein